MGFQDSSRNISVSSSVILVKSHQNLLKFDTVSFSGTLSGVLQTTVWWLTSCHRDHSKCRLRKHSTPLLGANAYKTYGGIACRRRQFGFNYLANIVVVVECTERCNDRYPMHSLSPETSA